MNKFILVAIGVIVLAGTMMSGLFSLQPNKNQNYQPVSATAACVDFNPPSTSDTVTFNTVQYDLIKKDARVSGPNPKNGEENKFRDMENVGVGTTNDGKQVQVYKLRSTNYFGESNSSFNDIVYVLKEQKDGSSFFDVYLRAGVQIPDFIKNCKSTGGQIAIVGSGGMQFPPSAFNKDQIKNPLTDLTSLAPAYIYSNNSTSKKSFDYVKSLNGVKNIGSLPVADKNKEFPLYFHLGTVYLIDGVNAYEYLPNPTSVNLSAQLKKSLQLQKITFVTVPTYSWYTPECKPAIYLYPQKTEEVNVKVNTIGYLTLTIPDYPKDGWTVTANPNGNLEVNKQTYPYLYYEAAIPDSEFKKPTKGYVVKKSEISSLFNEILPKLGLSVSESKEFKDYWQKSLPLSPYYFVAIMDKEAIENIEPLVVSPKPKTVIRVRLYFELLDKPINVEKPLIITPKRDGFTLVEWGGMVKTDKDHPFTCSQ